MEQVTKQDIREVLMKLNVIQNDMGYIKEYLVDISMNDDDIIAIEKYEKEKRDGKLLSQKELEKELEI